MRKALLSRVSYTDSGTFGVLLGDKGIPILLTLENPWLANEPFISCIPVGLYECKPVDSPKFGLTWEVTNVHGRTNILFHRGNTEPDTSGCILVGNRFGDLNGIPAVLESGQAFRIFEKELLGAASFELAIVDVDIPSFSG